MVKKIKKNAKFVVCCMLIMSLVAPSYAALSASDGSAFVTKAEFDSALADFNARLTTFEAGINSKIDSQVSSYLDRNGIWNGLKQTVKLSNKWDGYYFVKFDKVFEVKTDAEEGYFTNQRWVHTEPGVPDGKEEQTIEASDPVIREFYMYLHRVAGALDDGFDVVVIENVTKSGLCLIEYDVIDAYDMNNNTGETGIANRIQWELPYTNEIWSTNAQYLMTGSWGNHDYWVLSCSRQIGTVSPNGTFVPKTSRECFFEDYMSAFSKGWSTISWIGNVSKLGHIGDNVNGAPKGSGFNRAVGYVTHNRPGRLQDFVFVSKNDKLVFHYKPSYHVTPYGPVSPYVRNGYHNGDVDCFKPLSATVY